MDVAKLKEKLTDAGVPADIIKSYEIHYKYGIKPEIAFENDELPPDDNFRTLAEVCRVCRENGKENQINEFMVKHFLSIPYSRVEATKAVITELFPGDVDEIFGLYEKNTDIYSLDPDEAKYIYGLLADYFKDEEKLWQVFKRAAAAGEFLTDSRIEAVVSVVGDTLAPDVIYESIVNGYLLHPYDTNPIGALKYLKTLFDEETTAKIIIENPDYLYLYKDEYYIEFPEQKAKREKEISDIIEKYK